MAFKNLLKHLSVGCIMILATACQKQSNLYTENWIATEAGPYKVNSILYTKYSNDQMVEQKEILQDYSTFILKSIEAEGSTCYEMDIYGNYLPEFLNHPSTGLAWTTEYDNKRITFGYMDPSIGYIPAATLSIEHIGKKDQTWNYVQAYKQGVNDIYVRYEYKVSRIQ